MPKKKRKASAKKQKIAAPSPRELERMVHATGKSKPQTIDMTQLRVFGVVANSKKPNAVQFAHTLAEWLDGHTDKEVLTAPEASVEAVVRSADFIVAIGGDGTILNLARHMTERPVPVFGVNSGGLGFLTGAHPEEAILAIEEMLDCASVVVEPRLLLRARVWRDGKCQEPVFQALNDVVVNRESLTRFMEVEISIEEESYTHFLGDGVIVATPTGSTAYSMSAGGPVVFPTLNDIIVTAICPHASALRSIVVPGDQRVRIRVFCDRKADRALLSCDGQTHYPLEWGDVIECTRSPIQFPLVKSPYRKYFDVLREKFKIPFEKGRRK